MLSVIRELAEEAEDPRNADLEPAALLKKLIERGEDALARTPDQLAVLREAGVVDAGGAGLLEIVRGVSAALSGEPLPDAPAEDAHEAGLDAVHQELSEFQYCTVFMIEGENLDAEALEAELDLLGDSLLVVGDSTALKIHVHTDEPGKALAFGTALGTIEGVEIANMHKQTEDRTERITSVLNPVLDARDRGRRGRAGRGQPPPLRELRRDARDRGRPDDEPLDRRHPRRDRGDARDRGARAPQQLERDPLRRAGRQARGQAGSRHPLAVGARRPRGDRPLPALARRRRERGGDARGARAGRDRRGDRRLARRRAGRRGGAEGRLARARRRHGGRIVARLRRGRGRSRRPAARRRPRDPDAAHGRGRAVAGRAPAAGSGSGTRASRSKSSRAASRTTRSSSPPSSAYGPRPWRLPAPADPRPARRGQRRLPPGARAPPRAAGGHRGGRRRLRGIRGRRRVQGVQPGRVRDGLPAARHGRRRDDDRARARTVRRRGRLPDRLREPA